MNRHLAVTFMALACVAASLACAATSMSSAAASLADATPAPGPNSAARVRAFARLPDWSGIWQSSVWLADESGRPPGGIAQVTAEAQLHRDPPYNSEWALKYRADLKDTAAIDARFAAVKGCTRSFPSLMEGPRMFQMALLPEETLLIFDGGEVRHVYSDDRGHPPEDELWPTSLGDSIGHWDGDTLVVDTIARASRFLLFSPWPAKLSDRAHFTERLRRLDDENLEDKLTIEDTVALARPWTLTLKFKRLRNMPRLMPYDCEENDRNPVVDGKIGIKPP